MLPPLSPETDYANYWKSSIGNDSPYFRICDLRHAARA